MALASKSDNNVQWTVTSKGKSAAGGNSYELREVATGKKKTIESDPESSAIIEKLIEDNIEMLKRLADR